MKPTPLIFIIYDGINNSVFHGQVVKPLVQKAIKKPEQQFILVSFERTEPRQLANLDLPSNISIQLLRQLPFFGTFSIWYAAYQLKKITNSLERYNIISRGPLAGLIALTAAQSRACSSITIQARGLLMEEYLYTHKDEKNWYKKAVHAIKARLYGAVEKKVYALNYNQNTPTTLEAVSDALRDHLIATYHTPPNAITIADQDMPAHLATAHITTWRTRIREQLNIDANTYVYCYNGSAKAWQCPELVIQFFQKQLIKEKTIFLMILTQDQQAFRQLLEKTEIPQETYNIMHVPHADIYQYLAACDAGIIFREKSIVNWISRPTKVLEYRAVGLTIIHNNNVKCLNDLATVPCRDDQDMPIQSHKTTVQDFPCDF